MHISIVRVLLSMHSRKILLMCNKCVVPSDNQIKYDALTI